MKMILSAGAAGFIGLSLNAWLSLRWVKVKNVEIDIKRLPKELDGLRILQITDLHNGSSKRMDLDIWKKVFKLSYDIVFITGDLTKAYYDQILPHKNALSAIAAAAPTFFVDGNHEKTHFSEMKSFLESVGIMVLDDKKITIPLDNTALEIIGTRDYYYQKHYKFRPFKKLMENEPTYGFRILLSHQPQIIDMLDRFNNILVISGHTHGGQIRLPFMPAVIAPGQGIFPKYGAGLYKVHGNYLYVSCGIGPSRVPIRLFNRPEIGLLTLRRSEV